LQSGEYLQIVAIQIKRIHGFFQYCVFSCFFS